MDKSRKIPTLDNDLNGNESKGLKKYFKMLNKKLTPFFGEYGYLFYAGLIPAVIMYLIYVAHGTYPFGDESVLVLDLNGQYVYFYEAIRNSVYGDTSLLYSFSRALGGEFMGILAYYVASPFTYIVCLFPQTRILEALLTIFLLKTALLGITFGFYLHKTVKDLGKVQTVAFSILYALTSYAVVQQHNSMWIDAVIWLPVLTYCIEQLIKHGKFKGYVFFLALVLVSNYYIGYMMCLYTAAYFFYYYVAKNRDCENNPHGEKRHFWKSFMRIGAYSVLGAGIAAIIIFTAYYSLTFGKNTFSTTNWKLTLRFDFLQFIGKLLPGSYDTVRPEGFPFVYCGVITLILAPLFFISKKYNNHEKIAAGAMITFFLISFSFSTIDLIWHGFQRPNWLNYRYSFMFCFFLLVLAAKAFSDIKNIGAKPIFISSCILGIIVMILQAQGYEYVKDFETVWFSAACIGLYLIVLCVTVKTKFKNNVAIIMTVIICMETFANGVLNMYALDSDVVYSGYSKYNNYFAEIRPVVNMVQENDKSFYRMEKTTFKKTNDNFALNMRGLSCSTSTLNKETIAFLNAMGYASKSHWSKYLGGTPVNDSILGLKYIVSKDDLSEYYEAAYTANGYTAYLNPYALSIAFGVAADVKEIKDEKSLTLSDSGYMNPFDALNALVTAMLGEDKLVQVFVPVKVSDITKSNLKTSPVAGYTKYEAENTSSSATLSYTFELPDYSGEYFLYLPGVYPREVKLLANGTDKGTFYGNETTRIVSVGTYEANSTLNLKMTLKNSSNNLFIKNNQNCLYYIDREVFESAMSRLAEMQLIVDENYTETYICGTFTSLGNDQTVLTTIPYDEGWHLKIDGKDAEIYKSLDALITFDIEDAGEHYIELTYKPTAYVLGLTVSLVSLTLFILLIIFEKKLRSVPVIRVLFECYAPKKDAELESAEFIPLLHDTEDESENEGKTSEADKEDGEEFSDDNGSESQSELKDGNVTQEDPKAQSSEDQ